MATIAGILLILLAFLTGLGAWRGILYIMGTSTTTTPSSDYYPKGWPGTLAAAATALVLLVVGLSLLD